MKKFASPVFGEGFQLYWFLDTSRPILLQFFPTLKARRWHADVQTRPKENPGPHADGRRDVCPQRIVVRVILLDHTDKPLAAKGVNPLALRIEIHVVARSPHRDPRNLFTGIGIKYNQ